MASPLLYQRIERAREQARREHFRNQLESSFKHDPEQNNVTVFVFSPEEVTGLWLAKQRQKGKSDEEINSRYQELVGDDTADLIKAQAAGAVGLARDSKNLGALMLDFKRSGNVLGKYRTQVHKGRKYVIFQGNHKLRNIIKGTRYAYRNPKILKMGIGAGGATTILKGNVAVTVVVSPIVNGYSWIFDPKFGWEDFLKNVPSDIVKASLAGVVGALVTGVLAVGASTMAIPLGVGVVVSFGVGFTLSMLDQEGELTDSVIEAAVATYDRVYSKASNYYQETSQSIKRRASMLEDNIERIYYYLFDDEVDSCKVQAPTPNVAEELRSREKNSTK